MGWFASWVVAAISGVLGLVAAGFVANLCADWYRVSGFEGKAGYVVLSSALIGGLAGAAVGLVTARVVAAMIAAGFLTALGISLAIIVVCASAVALAAWTFADIPPRIAGQELMLEIELRLPRGETTPPGDIPGAASFALGSVVDHVRRAAGTGNLQLDAARLDDGRWIIPVSVFLFTARGQRSIDVQLGGKRAGGFIVPLPARPGSEFLQWSDWGPREDPAGQPWPETAASYRFRVVRIAPPSPAPTPEESQAQEAAKQQAAFEAVPRDAPIGAWFPYTRYDASEERRGQAIRAITEKPGYVAELGALMLVDDARTAAEALYLVEFLPNPPAALTDSVATAGRRIAALLHKVNATPVEEDPSLQGAADISIRFSAWMVAARALRQVSGANLVPELVAILELSRVRADSYVLRNDVRRVASYYANLWAGIVPLPDDPPPK